jgi:hypothetical protein
MGAIIKKTINKAPLEETEERKEARKDVKNKRWHRQEKQKTTIGNVEKKTEKGHLNATAEKESEQVF